MNLPAELTQFQGSIKVLAAVKADQISYQEATVDYLKTCPVCLSVVTKANRVKMDYLVMICGCCRSVFEPIDNALTTKKYTQSYYSSLSGAGYTDYAKDMEKNRLTFVNRIKKLRQMVPHASKILDIGCALGETLKVAQEMGFEKTVGVEVSDYCVDMCKKQGLDVTRPEQFEKTHTRYLFDLITMQDVLEHTINPLELLSFAFKHLDEKGAVFICTPDIESWSRKLLRGFWYHFKSGEHRVYFCKDSLHFALLRSGFTDVKICSDTSYMALERILQRLQSYSPFVFGILKKIVIALGLSNIIIPLKVGNLSAIARKAVVK